MSKEQCLPIADVPANSYGLRPDDPNKIGLYNCPAEIYNMIMEHFTGFDPKSVSTATYITQSMRKHWLPVLHKTIGPIRVDEHLDDAVLDHMEEYSPMTEQLVFHYNSNAQRTDKSRRQIYKNFQRLVDFYRDHSKITTVAVTPNSIFDWNLDSMYGSLLPMLPDACTVVIPSVKRVEVTGSPQKARFDAIIQPAAATGSQPTRRIFVHGGGNASHARGLLSPIQDKLDTIMLFGIDVNCADRHVWVMASSLLGLRPDLNATSVFLHYPHVTALNAIELSPLVESLGIYDVRGPRENNFRSFIMRYLDAKVFTGHTKLEEFHCVQSSHLSDSDGDIHDTHVEVPPWRSINQVTFNRMMNEITDMRVLSIHQNRPLNLDQVAVQCESMRMLSVRKGLDVLEQDALDHIAQNVPYLEGLGVNCDSFQDLHKHSVRNTGLDGARFWAAVKRLSLVTVVFFVPPSDSTITEEQMQVAEKRLDGEMQKFCHTAPTSLQTVHIVFRGMNIKRNKLHDRSSKHAVSYEVRYQIADQDNAAHATYPLVTSPTTGVSYWDYSKPSYPPKAPQTCVRRILHSDLSASQYKDLVALDGHHEMWMEDYERTQFGHLYYSEEALRKVEAQEVMKSNEVAKEKAENAKQMREQSRAQLRVLRQAQTQEQSERREPQGLGKRHAEMAASGSSTPQKRRRE